MNQLRDLIAKMDMIAEADDPRAQYDKFKADDARTAAIAQVKKLMSTPLSAIPRLGDAIDPKTGIIYYGDASREDGGGNAKPYPYKWLADPASTSDQSQAMYKILTPAGLKVIPVEQKGLFGSSQVAGISLQQLADLDKPVAPPAVDPVKPNPAVRDNPALTAEMLAKLQAAVQALQAAMSAPTPKLKEYHLSVARSLMESFGYNVDEGFNDSATDLINARQANFNMNNGGELAIKQAKRRAELAAERAAAAEAEKAAAAAAQKVAAPAVTAAADAAAPALTKVADQAGISAGEKAGATLAKDAAKTGLLKGAGKIAGKLMPGVGLAFGAKDAYDRYKQGDYLGAGLSGLSGVASLVPGIGTAASIGLDAANLARDYKKSQAAPAGAPAAGAKPTAPAVGGSDSKLAQLQKIIGAKADGVMGPETSTKLKAWQQSQGIAADGMPGPETYGKAGIKESQQTVSEGIRSLQERLSLIEAKGVIRANLDTEYLWDDKGSVYTMEGEQVTDPLTLSVIWESVTEKNTTVQLDEFISLNALKGLGKGALDLGKSAVKGAGEFMGGIGGGAKQVAKGGKNASAAVAKVADKAGGLKGAGLKTGAALARNPVKTALGAAALGGAAGYGLTNAEGPATTDKPATTTTGPSTTTNTPSTTTTGPEQGGKGTDLSALIQAVKDAMMPLSDMAEGSPEIMKALTDARVVLDMAEKSGSEQLKVDANNSADAKVAASTPPAVAAKPAGGPEQSGKSSNPDPTLKVYKESDDELTRWLKIARG
jgi:peptidoglycan hydrolase-like protein with peptidoglycan-binding domain